MAHPELHDRLLALRRSAIREDALERGSAWCAAALLGLGTLALLLRLGAGLDAGRAAFALAPVVALPAAAWVAARRRAPGLDTLAAALDRGTGGSGALVTAFEVDDARWGQRVAPLLVAAPAGARADRGRVTRRVLGGAAFAAAALAVPVAALRTGAAGPPPAVFEPALARVEAQLAALDELVTLPPDTRDGLRETLERLREEARASEDPEATFEALARLAERAERTAEEALDAAATADAQLGEAAARAAAGADAEAALGEALAELAEGPLDLEALLADLPAGLAAELAEAGLDLAASAGALPEGLSLSPELAEGLSEALRELLREQLEALAAAGLLDPAALAGLGEHALIDPADLAGLTPEELAELQPCPGCKDLEPGGT